MTYSTALKHFKTGLAIAEVLGIKSQAVYQWKKTGVVPIKSATRLQTASKGRVKVDPKVYERANGRENAGI
jgi:hypothetical protein